MIGKWFSKSGKGKDKALQAPLTSPTPPVAQPAFQTSQIAPSAAAEWDASTVIVRAEPATLVVGGSFTGAPWRAANAFEAATMMYRPGAGFDQATLVGGAQAVRTRIAPDLPLPAGTVLNNRYEVIKPIGRGGFSYVYLCQHRRNGRLNAVKEAYGPDCGRSGAEVVAGEGYALRQATDALLREVSAISRINHPGVVRFEDAFGANGTLCFAMDFVEGEPLSGLLARRHGISADTFGPLAASLLDAVETLHANDVLHGDIKPGNIILRPDKSAVLIDFGTAARLTDMSYAEPILTPGYSAPERYVPDGDVGAWSDVFSCAATLTAAMAGQPPPDLGGGGDANPTKMAAFLRAAGERFPESESWIRGAELGLRLNISDRTATIGDLRAAMGMAARKENTASSPTADRSDGRSIFISYAHSDSIIVEALVRALQRRGAGVWIDRQGIKPGSRAWGVEILNGMRGAQIVLLFSSARSMASENVKDEVYLAKELRKPIVVARLDHAPFSDEILMFLTRTQHIPAAEMEPPAFAAAVVDALNAGAAAA
jgi:serine/threonine protein kinase